MRKQFADSGAGVLPVVPGSGGAGVSPATVGLMKDLEAA